MIETTKSYKVGDKIFATFEEAQLSALTAVFNTVDSAGSADKIAGFTLDHSDEILSILTMSEPKERTRKPRSDRGKKHRIGVPDEPVPMGGVKVEGSGKYAGK